MPNYFILLYFLYKIGGALHLHSSAFTPVEFYINATYRPLLWYCNETSPASFKFAKTTSDLPKCKWELVATARARMGATKFDAWLHSIFSIFTSEPKGILCQETVYIDPVLHNFAFIMSVLILSFF